MEDPKNSPWRTGSQHRNFTKKLLQSLKSPEKPSGSAGISPSLAVKEAADSALAITAKGKTRWSRAILAKRQKRFKLKRVSIRRRLARLDPAETKESCRIPAKRKRQEEKKDAFSCQLHVLARLVPGGKKLPAPVLLEETTDYISALEMQVRAMSALADLLSASTLVTS